jgi:hypothetical protein
MPGANLSSPCSSGFDIAVVLNILQHFGLFDQLQVRFARDNRPFGLIALFDNLYAHLYTSPLGQISERQSQSYSFKRTKNNGNVNFQMEVYKFRVV